MLSTRNEEHTTESSLSTGAPPGRVLPLLRGVRARVERSSGGARAVACGGQQTYRPGHLRRLRARGCHRPDLRLAPAARAREASAPIGRQVTKS